MEVSGIVGTHEVLNSLGSSKATYQVVCFENNSP
jgi:hypothetical protein